MSGTGHLKPISNAEVDRVRAIYPNDVTIETARAETIRVTLEEAFSATRPKPKFPWEKEAEQKPQPKQDAAPAPRRRPSSAATTSAAFRSRIGA